MQNRRFVLAPMAEIAPELEHPVSGKTMSRLLAECPDDLAVNKK
jgi:2-amino-4-hydroxy-6-hydroxymethyldihydropteridine diphosphokinase